MLKMTAEDMVEFGIAEAIIDEPNGSAHYDVYKIAENIKEFLVETLKENSSKNIDILLEERYSKFRKIGEFTE